RIRQVTYFALALPSIELGHAPLAGLVAPRPGQARPLARPRPARQRQPRRGRAAPRSPRADRCTWRDHPGRSALAKASGRIALQPGRLRRVRRRAGPRPPGVGAPLAGAARGSPRPGERFRGPGAFHGREMTLATPA